MFLLIHKQAIFAQEISFWGFVWQVLIKHFSEREESEFKVSENNYFNLAYSWTLLTGKFLTMVGNT